MSFCKIPFYKTLGVGSMALLILFGVTGCGFRPLYGEASRDQAGYETERKLAAIKIMPIADRIGQQVHNYLRDNLNPGGQPQDPAYFLDVHLAEATPSVLTRRDLGALRTNIRLRGAFTLTNGKGDVLLSGKEQAITGFDVFRDPLNDISAREDAERRTAELLARMISTRVASFLSVAKAP